VRRNFPDAFRLWLRTAEEIVAVQAVDYFEWVLKHLRRLVAFMLGAIMLSVALLSSYPYQPETSVKGVFLVVLVGSIVTVLTIMSQMNRDEVLSRITKTDPGRITWDRTYLMNIALFGVIPLITFIGSDLPILRNGLFAWLQPIVRLMTRQ
jgi:hypothetical protein